jgi:serine/threonine protein kinase
MTASDAYRDRFFKSFSQDISQVNNKQYLKSNKVTFADKYELKCVIGEGSNAIVKLLVERSTGVKLAMKSFKTKTNWPGAYTEANILSKLVHPNIIQFERLFRGVESVHMILEYFEGETLSDYCKRGPLHDERTTAKIVLALLTGLNHCHKLSNLCA